MICNMEGSNAIKYIINYFGATAYDLFYITLATLTMIYVLIELFVLVFEWLPT